jgi:hypothetical protein
MIGKVKETGGLKKARLCTIVIAVAFVTYSCAVSCGPGLVSYPSDYRLEKQSEKALSK